MYELIQAGERTFYMDCPTKVGFFRTDGNEVVLIDSGSDKDAAKKVKRHLDAQGWKLKAIYNTHSHADHIGGNQYLQSQTGCAIYAPGLERCAAAYPVLEPTVLYGGFAMRELRGKFLMARESEVKELTAEALPEGLELLPLPGHSYEMTGFRTADDVVFLADALSSAETLRKYRIGVLYDVRAYLNTLETVKTLRAARFIPSHAAASDEIAALAQENADAVNATAEELLRLLAEPKTFEEVLGELFSACGLTMDLQQYVLVGNTVRSYLSWLRDEGRIGFRFEGNRMLWNTL